MIELLHRLLVEEEGQDLIEYALIMLFVSLSCYMAVRQLGNSVGVMWSRLAANVAAFLAAF